MNDLILLEWVERYLNDEMTVGEKAEFEQLRRQRPDVDQMVVEQQMFLNSLKHYGKRRQFKNELMQIHQNLVAEGVISDKPPVTKLAPVVEFWNRYKRTIVVAASIAGITALSITAIMQSLAPKSNQSYLLQLSRKVSQIEGMQREQHNRINRLIDSSAKSPDKAQISGGSSFLIDEDGYLVTNAHVVNGSSTLVVVNKGVEYIATKVYENTAHDLAILQITDKDWVPVGKLPYSIRKGTVDLGEEVFTLGYPRNEIVYNKGYMSASSGYYDDSLSIQIAISANPGNSGGPVLDKNGNIVGILSTKDKHSQDVVFASKAINICLAIEELKKDQKHANLSSPKSNALKGMDRVQQIKKIQDCVFMVKGY
jgi:S1-C subfamily serine protease